MTVLPWDPGSIGSHLRPMQVLPARIAVPGTLHSFFSTRTVTRSHLQPPPVLKPRSNIVPKDFRIRFKANPSLSSIFATALF